MAAPAAAADVSGAGSLPFSVADLGWITLAAAALIAIAMLLQMITRRRRRHPMRAVVPRRTDS